MSTDKIEKLVGEAHAIFDDTSILEVIDLDEGSARDVLNKFYGRPEGVLIDRYLDVLEKLRRATQLM